MIAFDAVTTGVAEVDGTLTLTVAHTIAPGSNLVLYVGVGVDSTANRTPASCKWNGTAMTNIGSVLGSAANQTLVLYRLVNPEVGTFNVVIVPHVSAGPNDLKGAVIRSYSGVDQTTPDDTPVTDAGSDTSVSSVVSSATGDLVIDAACINGNPTITPGGSQTQRANVNQGGAGGTMHGASEQAGGASITMSWSWTGARRTAQVAVNVNAAGAVSPTWPGWMTSKGGWV